VTEAYRAGMRMPGWFDLSSLDDLTDSKYDDEQGLIRSVDAVDRLVQAEIDAGIPANKIVVGGFSQGGAIAMLYGLTKGRDLAGMVGLSTWVVLNHKITEVSQPLLGWLLLG
jgi:predicted esterase